MSIRRVPARWTRLEPSQRRQQILREARRLFHERPYSGVSTQDVARAAGVTRGLVHHYFGTKRELFLAVVRDAMGRLSELHPSSGAAARSGDAVAHGVDLWLDAVEADPHVFVALVATDGLARDRALERIVSEGREALIDAVVDVLGLPPSEEVRAGLRAYAGLVEAATREWIINRTMDRRQVRRLLVATLEAVVHALGGGGGAPSDLPSASEGMAGGAGPPGPPRC